MNIKFDRYAGLAFLTLGIGIVAHSMSISQSAYGSSVGPRVFPLGLGIILILLSLRLLYETFKYNNPEKKSKETMDYKRFGIILGAMILYALLFEKLGYILCTFVFLLVAFQTMKKGKWLSSIIISGVFSMGIYYVFVDLMKGTLPGFPIWFGQ